jgi:hypothetical protein
MLLLSVWLLACRPAVDAPDDVEEQAVFGFVHFDEPGFVEAVADDLLAFVRDPPEELEEGFLVDSLRTDDLAAVGVVDPVLDGVIGALGRALYVLDPAGVALGTTDPGRESWWDSVERFDVIGEEGDRDCFLAKACDRYEQTVSDETQIPMLGRASRTFTNQLRWVTSDAGEELLAVRQLAPDPVDLTSTLLAIDQQYSFALVGEHEEGAVRAEAIWVDARVLGAELPEGFAVRQAVGQMQTAADTMGEAFSD